MNGSRIAEDVQKPCHLILFPGLGADRRQFEPQRAEFPGLAVPPWIAPRPSESLPDYAARMAETVPHGPNVVLGGSSFGGMVAYEMAGHVRPAVVVLIGSCRSPQAIGPMLRLLRPACGYSAGSGPSSGGYAWPCFGMPTRGS